MTALQKAIDHFADENGRGGRAGLAKALQVDPMAITQWKRRGIPPERCVDIEVATAGAVTRLELRPDIFGEVLTGQAS